MVSGGHIVNFWRRRFMCHILHNDGVDWYGVLFWREEF